MCGQSFHDISEVLKTRSTASTYSHDCGETIER